MRTMIFILAGALGAASVQAADDYPKLKAGQWEITRGASGTAGSVPSKTTMCTDEALQRELTAMGIGMNKEMCVKTDIKRDGARIVITSECKIGESNIKSRAVMTMSGDTGYRTEIVASYDPPFMNMRDSTTMLEGKYVGACRDGLVPGDMVLANGHKMNIKGLADRKPSVVPAPPAKSK